MEKPVAVDGPAAKKMFALAEKSLQKSMKIGVGLDRIDRRQPQPLQLGYLAQNLLYQQTKPRRIARDVDAGQHDLTVAAVHQPLRLGHHIADRHRT